MSKKHHGKKGRKRSKKSVDSSIERMREQAEVWKVRNALTNRRRKMK